MTATVDPPRAAVRRVGGITGVFLVLGVLAACSEPVDHSPRASIGVQTFVLRNGMTVVIHEDHRIPKVKVTTKVGVGSADEPPGRGGFAHLFEHLMFMGTKAAPNFDVVMEQVGGENNAYTDFDETVFYESGPSNALPSFLWLEADRFTNLASYMTDAKVNLQRDVVLNEMRQNVLDTPGAGAQEAANTGLFPKRHPYERPVIGSIADLKAAKVADVVDFFGRYYVPSNLTMIVAGDVNTRTTIRQIKSMFGGLEKRNPPPRPASPQQTCSPCTTKQAFIDAVANPSVNLEWAPAVARIGGSISDPNLELAAIMMSNSFTNALQKHLVREQRLATSVSVSYDPKELAGFFEVSAEAASGLSTEKLRIALENELQLLTQQGFAASELTSAKISTRIAIAESLEEVGARTDLLQTVLTRYGTVAGLVDFEHRFDAATVDSVRVALKSMMAMAPKVTQIVSPGDRGDYPSVLTRSSGIPAAATLKARPARSIGRPIDLPRSLVAVPIPVERRLKNGIVVSYFRRPDAPRTRLLMTVRGGSERDPVGREGTSEFVGALMTRGAGKRDAEALTKALALTGAEVSVAGGVGGYSVRLNAPAVSTPEALAILHDVVVAPRFEENEVSLVVGEAAAGLEAAQTDPQEMAQRSMSVFYPPGHPNGRYATIASLKKIDANALRAEYQSVFQPQNATIVASGTMPVDELVQQLNTAFAGWKNNGAPTKTFVDARPPDAKLQTILVDIPGASQTTLLYRATGMGPLDPSYLEADASALILGGTFTSRLNAKLREEKGYTYGASARLEGHPSYGVVRAGTSVETSVTGPALMEFLGVVKKFRTGDITPVETRIATSATFTQSLDLISTSSNLVESLQARRDLGQSWATLEREFTKVAALDQAALKIGATTLLDGKRTIIVISGDLAKVRPQLKGMDLGKVTEVKPPV
jgi:zinc protease